MSETNGAFTSCADGFAMNGYVCSEDMFVEWGAPPGGFQALCPVTCGTGCPDSSYPDYSYYSKCVVSLKRLARGAPGANVQSVPA